MITRYVAVRAGELLQVQTRTTGDVQLLMQSQLCGTIARTTGQALEAGYLALEEEPVRIQVRHCPHAPLDARRPSVQLMITIEPPGSAVSSDSSGSGAQLLTDEHTELLELFGVQAGSLPRPMGEALSTMLATLDTTARAAGASEPAGTGAYSLTVVRTAADRIEHNQYRLAGKQDNLYLATSFDSMTEELRCMLMFFSIRGVRVQGAAVHRGAGRSPRVTADPVGAHLRRAAG